jgi:hypothetical protein
VDIERAPFLTGKVGDALHRAAFTEATTNQINEAARKIVKLSQS